MTPLAVWALVSDNGLHLLWIIPFAVFLLSIVLMALGGLLALVNGVKSGLARLAAPGKLRVLQAKQLGRRRIVLAATAVMAVVVLLAITTTVPFIEVTDREPYTATETYIVEVPYTETEIAAWRDEHTPLPGLVNIDDLSVEEISDIFSGKTTPEIPPMPPKYEWRQREVIEWRDDLTP